MPSPRVTPASHPHLITAILDKVSCPSTPAHCTTPDPPAPTSQGLDLQVWLPCPTSPLPSSDPYSSPVLKSAFLSSQSLYPKASPMVLKAQNHCSSLKCVVAHVLTYQFMILHRLDCWWLTYMYIWFYFRTSFTKPRLASKFWFPSLYLSSARITGFCHHTQLGIYEAKGNACKWE